ncbi:MAG: CPBP family intramembrane metalloprotease [Gemmatimonadales bacterium]|nr:CPBP family intramembrane metalloprotease [Gemmatimonadales bacterium]MYL06904.1 CPBP family intramembrane metalloprotease [Gemmatimonadales bacterium]
MIDFTPALPFLLLWAAFGVSMWAGRRSVALAFVALSLAAVIVAGVVEWTGLAVLVLFTGACLAAARTELPRVHRALAWGVVVILTLALGFNQVPGIHSVLVLDGVYVSASSADFTLYWDYDKGFAGILLYLACVQPQASPPWRRAVVATGAIAILTTVVTLATATAVGYMAWDPKWPAILGVWIPSNLLLTCVSEETVFRGILQRHLGRALSGRVPAPALVALIVCAAAFGAAHFAGGTTYVLLSTLAGIGYGAAYHVTGRVEAGILVHFLLNLSHLVLFTYPFAA